MDELLDFIAELEKEVYVYTTKKYNITPDLKEIVDELVRLSKEVLISN